MDKNYIKIRQNSFFYYCINITVEELLNIYTIEFYSSKSDSNGYQRLPKKNHYMKLVKYLIEDKRPILVPALIGAIDKNDVEWNDGLININGKIRIVDGQHRIEAFKYIRSNFPGKYELLRHEEFLMQLMVIEENEKFIEVSTFIDINSKNKKVDLDLAIQLKHRLVNKEDIKEADSSKIFDFCTTEVLNKLNSNPSSVWYNVIRVGNDLDKKMVSSKAFQRSIMDIVTLIYKETSDTNVTINKVNEIINNSWNEVKKRWPKCFEYPFDYNIQKGVGLFPLNMIISELIQQSYKRTGNVEEEFVRSMFNKIISNELILEADWIVGGTLSKYNSKAGFNFIKDVIEGKKRLERDEDLKI